LSQDSPIDQRRAGSWMDGGWLESLELRTVLSIEQILGEVIFG